MNKRQTTLFSLFAAALVLLALFPMSGHEPRAAAQSEGGVLGACVQQLGGSCVLTTGDDCTKFQFGLWYGEGTFCQGDTPCSPFAGCPPISSACCLDDGRCLVLVPELCVEAGGNPLIVDLTPCFAVNCPQPCVGDLDDDGNVGIKDFLDLLHNWGACP